MHGHGIRARDRQHHQGDQSAGHIFRGVPERADGLRELGNVGVAQFHGVLAPLTHDQGRQGQQQNQVECDPEGGGVNRGHGLHL